MWQYFNNGDQVWTEWRHNTWVVVRVLTHDGLSWNEREGRLVELTSADKFFNQIVVFCLKLARKVFRAE